jgi:dolichol-phosphate mannosyltransferase
VNKLLIFTATLNENGNIQHWYAQVRSEAPDSTILVVDDGSIDGTNEFLKSQSLVDKELILYTRPKKLGLGSAHLFAYKYALEKNFSRLITLDADLSHLPSQLNRFLTINNPTDFIIGTRWGEGSCNYTGVRKLLSYSANKIARLFLRTGLTEYTSSYRSFSLRGIRVILENPPKNDSYAFFIETIEILFQHGISLSEIPIDFLDRTVGSSKIPKNQIFISAFTLIRLASLRVLNSITR